jgi:Iron-sulfur cluster-binding domain
VALREQLERLRSASFPEVDIPSWYFHEGFITRYCSAGESGLWEDGRCGEARRHFNIEPDGSIVLCCDFPDFVIGSLEEPPTDSLASDIRRALLEKRSSPCQRCCSFHPARDPRSLIRG